MRDQRVLLRIGILVLVCAGIGAAGFVLYAEPPSVADRATVTLTENGFEPRHVTLRMGGTVTFTTTAGRPFWPASNLHPDHGIYPSFDPQRPLRPDETWTFQFDRAGEWEYHDHIRSYYIGTITVVK